MRYLKVRASESQVHVSKNCVLLVAAGQHKTADAITYH